MCGADLDWTGAAKFFISARLVGLQGALKRRPKDGRPALGPGSSVGRAAD